MRNEHDDRDPQKNDENAECGCRAAKPGPVTPRRAFLTGAAGVSVAAAGQVLLGGCRDNGSAAGEGDRTSSGERTATNDGSALRETDSKWLRYDEGKGIACRHRETRGIAPSSSGGLFAAGDRSILVYNDMGDPQSEIRLEGEPTCLAQGTDGWIYVGVSDHIEVFDASGQRLAVWAPVAEPANLTAIAVGDEVYAANAAGRIVLRYDRDGRLIGRIGEKAKEKGYSGLIIPSPHLDVAISSKGSILVSNPGMHRVEEHAPDGDLVSFWGKASSDAGGFCGCCNPTDFALLPDGRFVTSEKGIPRVSIYGADGSFDGYVAGPESFPSATMGLDLAVMADESIRVLDKKNNKIRAFTKKGAA